LQSRQPVDRGRNSARVVNYRGEIIKGPDDDVCKG
jgi:hypothetical protein